MKFIKSILFTLCVLTLLEVKAQIPSPGAKQSKSIMLKGATIHVGDGKVFANGAIAFEEGKITLVLSEDDLKKVKLKKYDTTIDVTGKHIYPSFIAANSTLGISEIESVRATIDMKEVGAYNPHIRSLIAFDTDSKVASTVKTNGVLYIQVTPRGGVISGKSSVVSLDAWNWEDAVLKTDEGIHLNFPSLAQQHGWWAEPEPASLNNKYEGQLNELKKFFIEAKYYCNAVEKPETNIRFEAMRSIFDGSANVYIHADYVKDIIASVNFGKVMGLKKIVIVGGKDSWKVTPLLKQNNIAVMVNRVHDLPNTEQEDIDQAYKLPYLLQKDSILFCLQNQGDMEGMNTRNLPFLAGTARAYGLSEEQAISSITLNAAKILGVDDKIGSLEVGKNASFFVSSGDALDMKTNNVEMAFVDGRYVDLNNSQKELYNKYMKKYNLPVK